jgi:predicted permease
VLLGFFLGDAVELAGAAVLTAGMWLVGWNLWRRSRETDRTTATLLVVSASVLVVTMLLALSWALGHVVATPYLPLEWMVATHGLANAVGFGLCGLLAWRRLQAAEGVG